MMWKIGGAKRGGGQIPCAAGLNRRFGALQGHRGGHRTVGNVIVPAVVVGECYEGRVGGGTGSTESPQHQETAVGVCLKFAERHRDSHEKTGVEKGGTVGTCNRARTRRNH